MRNFSAASNAGTHSAWRSPVPYLFFGIGAMLALIFFALFLLACSHWKESLRSNRREEQSEENKEHDGKDKGYCCDNAEEKIIVIMAGEENPTFLAKPTDVAATAI